MGALGLVIWDQDMGALCRGILHGRAGTNKLGRVMRKPTVVYATIPSKDSG